VKISITILFILSLFSTLLFGQEKTGSGSKMDRQIHETTEDRETQIKRMEEIARQYDLSTRAPINFYGKIVDQNGDPIEDVKVTLKIRDNAWQWETDGQQDTIIELTTNPSGLFSVEGKQGHFLFIDNLEKKGYEYDLTKNTRGFEYQQIENTIDPPFIGDPNNPVVFVLRQRGIVDYLLTESFRWRFHKDKNEPYQPLLLDQWEDAYGKEMNLYGNRSEKNRCLKISCSWNEDYSEFKLLFQCIVEGSGVCVSDQLLYEAPAEGYQQEITYTNSMARKESGGGTPGLYNEPLFLYVKGPEVSYYSRIDLAIRTDPLIAQVRENPLVSVSGKVYTNPQGRRYLDYDQDYNSKEKSLRNLLSIKRSHSRFDAERENKPFDETAFQEKIDQDRKNYTTEDLIAEYGDYIKNSRLNR
jgi:hypothetical protein